MDVGEFLGETREFEIRPAEAVAVPIGAAIGEAEGLHGRLRQIVDEDRRRAARPQSGNRLARLGDIEIPRYAVTRLFACDGAARAQRTDDDRLVHALLGELDIVGKGRGDAQIDAAGGGRAAQEIGLGLQLAIAEQQDVEPLARDGEIGNAVRRRHRPIGSRPLLQLPAMRFEKLPRIAPVGLAKLRGERGLFGLRVLVDEDRALVQRGDAAEQRIAVIAETAHQRRHLVRNVLRLTETSDELGNLPVDGEAHIVDRMDDQGAVGAERHHMDIAREADKHAANLCARGARRSFQ